MLSSFLRCKCIYPDSKVHGANMAPTWVLSAPDGPHVGPMNLANRVHIPLEECVCKTKKKSIANGFSYTLCVHNCYIYHPAVVANLTSINWPFETTWVITTYQKRPRPSVKMGKEKLSTEYNQPCSLFIKKTVYIYMKPIDLMQAVCGAYS